MEKFVIGTAIVTMCNCGLIQKSIESRRVSLDTFVTRSCVQCTFPTAQCKSLRASIILLRIGQRWTRNCVIVLSTTCVARRAINGTREWIRLNI